MKEKFDQSKLSAEQIHLGSRAHEDFKQGQNPPSWVEDEDTWAKAKEAALKSYDLDDDAYWPVVVSIYENMGGEVGGEDSLSNEGWNTALPNDAIDQDGWALIAPYGEWPKTRVYREGGQIKEQKFLQVLDNDSADALLSKENSLFRRLKRALVGIPVYKGHGDLNDVDPKAIANETHKIKLGVVDQVRKTGKGLEAHFALDNDGAEAVAAGYKFPSSFWYVIPNGKRGDTILARPVKLISVALTQYPNISGVESLANARAIEPAARDENQTKDQVMKQILIGWLAAKGIVLANDASDAQILAAVQQQSVEQAASLTALGNEKSNLSGKITALENERAAEKHRADNNATALANEQTARKAERKGRAEAIVDLAIARGKTSIAHRDAEITALTNSTDEAGFAAAADKLLKSATKHRTTASDNSAESGKVLANDNDDGRAEYDRQFKDELQKNGQDPVKAHAAVMRLPGLADKLRVKRAA